MDEYAVANNAAFFSKVLDSTRPLKSVLELGCNVGQNLQALKLLLPECRLAAVEINQFAAAQVKTNMPEVELWNHSIFEFNTNETFDLVFTKGVLIHVNPEQLSDAYQILHQKSNRYILVSEYYSRNPEELPYRGHEGKLFKRDFAGELLIQHQDLRLVDYGFIYHRDPNFPQDDMNWFLMEKQSST